MSEQVKPVRRIVTVDDESGGRQSTRFPCTLVPAIMEVLPGRCTGGAFLSGSTGPVAPIPLFAFTLPPTGEPPEVVLTFWIGNGT
jgi:hypothetical protein